MADLDERSLTAAVLEQFVATPDLRLKQIMGSLVQHLHDFVRDVEPTVEEWLTAIDFLTRVGQKCDDRRQEFILLSDVLGVSMLVDMVNHKRSAGATATTVMGPFFVEESPRLPLGGDITSGAPGEPLLVEGTVSAVGGGRIVGATVNVWQAGDDGLYDVQRPGPKEVMLRARFVTDAAGQFHFWSVQPKFYSVPVDGPVGELLQATHRPPFRPAHLHFKVSADRCEPLVTHLFMAGDKYLDSDAVFGVKQSLICEYRREPPGTAPDGRKFDAPWRRLRYDFNLKPE